MKKLFVLLLSAAVAVGASAGVNNKAVDLKEVKANILASHSKTVEKGAILQGTALKAFDATARPKINHAQKRGETLLWDFEDEAQVNDWTILDQDGDGHSWEYITEPGMKTHSGYGCMSSASYDNMYGILHPDNWLVSPTVELNGTFAFYAAAQSASYAAEVFRVYINVNDEWIPLSEDITSTGLMQAYTFDLSEYEGQEGCLAIRHYNVSDMFRLNVDDITIGEFEPEPEPWTPDIITEIPEGCQVNTYTRNSCCVYNYYGYDMSIYTYGEFKVAFAPNGDVYIQDPAWILAGFASWVKGTYDETTGIISIPVGQFVVWSPDYQYGLQLGWGYDYVVDEGINEQTGLPNYSVVGVIDENTEVIQFMIDGGDIYLLGSEGDLTAEYPNSFNATGMCLYYSDDMSWTATEFAKNGEAFGLFKLPPVAAVPANPTADDWYDCGDESGFSRFYFTLPTTDVDGNSIYPEFLSYSIFVDNGDGPEKFVFPAANYTFDLYEDIDEVSYNLYTYGVDFRNYAVYMYRTNAEGFEPLFTENIGIQVYYTVDGVRNASEIVWLYDLPSSVNEMNAGKTVASVRYFNVAGQEVAQPQGMTIKVTTYTDGTTTAVKVVK